MPEVKTQEQINIDLQGQLDDLANKFKKFSEPKDKITTEGENYVDVPFDAVRKIDKADINSFLKFPLTPASAPVNDYDIANKKYVDDNVGATITFPNSTVFNNTAPTTMTDLDLSSVVGANSAMVYLKVQNNQGSGSHSYNFRTKGDETVSVDTVYAIGGVTSCDPTSDNSIAYVWVLTNTSGVIQWLGVGAPSTVLKVMAYLK